MQTNINKQKSDNTRKQLYKVLIRIIILITLINVFIGILYITNKNNINYNVTTMEGWNKYQDIPILGNEETGTLFDPNVIKDKDGLYRMYVSWRKEGSIAVSTSKDGINWTEPISVLNKDTTTGWENIVNRCTVVYHNDKYYMWYTGQTDNESKIGYAISEDGYNFKRYGNPVIIPEEHYEAKSIMNPYVMYDEDEKIFKMWYAAGEKYEPDVLCYATSIDGVNWNKYENNPILSANKDKNTLDNFKVGACEVKKINKNEYIMFYIGYTNINTARIFVAKSNNGISNWQRYGETPIVSPSKGKWDSEACYKPSIVYDEENKRWLLYYNGRTSNKEYIGLTIYNKYEII